MDEKYPVEHEKEVSGIEATLGITFAKKPNSRFFVTFGLFVGQLFRSCN